MLRSVDELYDFTIHATDGEIGRVHDFLFDDHAWTIRYLVVSTGDWLRGRKVLLAPSVLQVPHAPAREFLTALTRQQVHDSPDVDTDMPVSRQREEELYRHYLWIPYWGAPGMEMGMPLVAPAVDVAAPEVPGDPHLRSIREVIGYHLQAVDGKVGRVADFLLDVGDWSIRYAIVDTGGWLPGKRMPLAPNHIRGIAWSDRRVYVSLTRREVECL